MRCYNCYGPHLDGNRETCVHCGALTHPPAVKYFYVHPLSFILRTLLTLGCFPLYWLYRNWKAVKETEGIKIHPLGRVLFYTYFCFGLFSRIYGGAKAYGYKSVFSASKLVMLHFVATYLLGRGVNIGSQADQNALFSLLSIMTVGIALALALLPLLLVQPAIKYYNTHTATDQAKA